TVTPASPATSTSGSSAPPRTPPASPPPSTRSDSEASPPPPSPRPRPSSSWATRPTAATLLLPEPHDESRPAAPSPKRHVGEAGATPPPPGGSCEPTRQERPPPATTPHPGVAIPGITRGLPASSRLEQTIAPQR